MHEERLLEISCKLRADGRPARGQAIEGRLFGRVVVTEAGCWEFQGNRDDRGYGAIRRNGKMEKTHRVAYDIALGGIPAGLHVCHHCDNPPCIRPSHLFAGTRSENQRDSSRKGRGVGAKNLTLGHERLRQKTHCPQGHPYAGANLYIQPDGRRVCRECGRESSRRYLERQRETS